ncbi:transposase [Aliiglaciecola lipolytica]|uniref:Transposase IS200-like domain-containing protein n=1 Tax=Aliiglaciecola lipolytica E3 TaxID=1127673 RepID=K6YT67_9ALTE|nr:transposase [Aliiglaciecola lipolytica]GAC14490.1 hypothetical protein GLIP_1861 [Aliiglaciecola lipolytica E3]
MPVARNRQISLIDTPYYHCVSRCVRRAFLCGKDKLTGKDYEHRRQWVEDRLLILSTIFCIDVCAFAVMSNHTHIVLHVNKQKALAMSDLEVIKRWQHLHKASLLAQQFSQNPNKILNHIEQKTLSTTVEIYRQRLFDISWFMRELNEPIARQANKEDECTGHFWEGRFKSQALLDEQTLAACMVYVDLNPIRANIEKSLETSRHTSIKMRIQFKNNGGQPESLMPFSSNQLQPNFVSLPFSFTDYNALINYTMSLRKPETCLSGICKPPLLFRLKVDDLSWMRTSLHFEEIYNIAAGTHQSLQKYKLHTNRKRLIGVKSA